MTEKYMYLKYLYILDILLFYVIQVSKIHGYKYT